MTSMISTRRTLFAVMVCVASASQMVAQGSLPGQAQCADAFARAANDARAAAREGILGGCGLAGTRLIARVVQGSTRDVDQSHFMRLRDVSPRSGVIFDAALALAVNPAAAAEARIGAMRILATQLVGRGGDLQIPGGIGALARGSALCFLGLDGSGDTTGVEGDPLPANYEERVRTSMEALALSANDPVVRNGARCVRAYFKPAMIEPLPAGSIEIAFVCGTQFRIRNTGSRSVVLTFDIAGRPGRTNVVSPVGDSFIVAEYPGVVRLYYAAQQIGAASSGSAVCSRRPRQE
jgi:hypothetical protein